MYLFGASGHGKVIADIILSSTLNTIEAFIDDNPSERFLLKIPVIHSQEKELGLEDDCIICVGNNKIRKILSLKIEANFIKGIHKKAIISEFSKIGEGTVVMAGAIVNADVEIGKHCIINTGSVVEHDCVIDDYVHLSPNSALAGNVKVGEGTHVGIGACVIQGVKIGKWVTIGAGAVVLKDVPDYVTIVGNPGRIINESK